jgi:hypothetical protein
MKWLTDILNMLPPSVRWGALAGVLILGIAYGHETRYMTVGQYTKSYVLDLKAEIRAIRNELERDDVDPVTEELLEEQLEALLDELCYEVPNDPYCRNR